MTTGWAAVSVSFGSVPALRDVTIDIPAGTVVAIVGGDGAGKTTLLRTLVREIAPDIGTVTAPGKSAIGYLPASFGSWANLSVRQNLDFVAGLYGLAGAQLADRRTRLLEGAGLWAAADRLAGQLSGGMRRKLGFCLAIVHDPELLVLDETSTGVDPVSRIDLWRMISQAAAGGAAVVMTTTYLDEAERAGHLVVLEAGEVLVQGTYDEVRAGFSGTITRCESPTRREWSWRRGRQRHEYWPPDGAPTSGTDVGNRRRGARSGGHRDRIVAHPARGGKQLVSGEVVLAAREVSRRFGHFTAVDALSLEVRTGEVVGLLGANGAGKTTLMRMLLGLLPVSSGSVAMLGGPPNRARRRAVGYVPQNLGLYRDLTLAENLDFVAQTFGRGTPSLPPDLAAYADVLVGSMPLGAQRQAAFLAALSHEPSIVLLDEPTSGVDALARANLWDTIRAESDAGVGVLVTTHYMQEAQQCDRLLLMARGRLVGAGSEADLIGDTAALAVTTADWAAAFAALNAANLPVALDGRDVRVADASAQQVRDVLASADLAATVTEVPATLEERMLMLDRRS